MTEKDFALMVDGSSGAFQAIPEDERRELADTANEQGEDASRRRREILSRHPESAAIIGDVSLHLELSIINRHFGGGMLADALPHKCGQMRSRMGYEDAPEIERLLIDRVVVTWMHLQCMEWRRASRWTEGAAVPVLSFYGREYERAQADHVRAIVALARVRKLRMPSVGQVNIAAPGAQQTNLAQLKGQGGSDNK